MTDKPGLNWTPPEEIALLDAESLAIVDDLIRTLATPTPQGVSAADVGTFDPYAEHNIGWLKAAHEQAQQG